MVGCRQSGMRFCYLDKGKKLLLIEISVALLRMNEKMEQSLNWLGLTADEQEKIYKKIPDKAKKYGEFYRINGEIYYAGNDSSWFITIPNEYRNLYPERFAYQEGKAEEPAFIHTQVIECLTGKFDEMAVLEDYIGVKKEHIGEFSIC